VDSRPIAHLPGAGLRHTPLDDAQAVGAAVVPVSLGLSLLASGGLLTGGTPGLAFLLCHATGLPLGFALFLRRRRGSPVGGVQLTVDGAILAGAFAVVDSWRVLWSLVGAVALNAVLMANHWQGGIGRPGKVELLLQELRKKGPGLARRMETPFLQRGADPGD
jgi:uncharacterized membrane-anchored protein YitT (DUF2179 family)